MHFSELLVCFLDCSHHLALQLVIVPFSGRQGHQLHCMKNVCILSFSGPYFPAYELNTERYGVYNTDLKNSEYGHILRNATVRNEKQLQRTL